MSISSINTNIAAYYAQANIGRSSAMASNSVARLSSGNRIIQASQDVAALAIGTGFTSQVSALRTALTNASQGTSLLQVADGALGQVTEILQRQRAIAFQAGSGTLRDSDRAFLQQEFAALTAEIDRLTGSSNFNGVNLLNGSLSASSGISSDTGNADRSRASLTFSDPIEQGEVVVIGGITLKAGLTNSGTTFAIGTSPSGTVQNLADQLNALSLDPAYAGTLGGVRFRADGNTLEIVSRSGGSIGDRFVINENATGSLSTVAQFGAAFTAGSRTVTITSTAHGLTSGDKIVLGNAGQTSVTPNIAQNNLFGKYTVTVIDANTYTIEAEAPAAYIGLANNAVNVATGVGAGSRVMTVTVSAAVAAQMANGQTIRLNGVAALTNVDMSTVNDVNLVISNLTGTTFDVTVQATGNTTAGAAGGASINFLAATSNGTMTVGAASATSNGDAIFDAGARNTFFNVFSTGVAATTTQVVYATATGNSPFQGGNVLAAQINGVTRNLYTMVTGNTLQDVVNGINANAQSTKVSATLVRSGALYNIRLSYDGVASNVRIDAGANYNSDTAAGGLALAGARVSGVSVETAAAGANDRYSLFYSNFTNLLYDGVAPSGNTITAANTNSAVVTAATPSGAGAPFRVGDSLTIKINGEERVLHQFSANETLEQIVAGINANSAATGIFATIYGTASNYGIRYYTNASSATRDVVTVGAGTGLSTVALNGTSLLDATGANLTQTTQSALRGGLDNGIRQGSVSAYGSVGDNILTALGQSKARVSLIATQNAVAGDTITIAGRAFTFTSNGTRAANEILIGSTIQETLDNAVSTLNSYRDSGNATGEEAYIFGQLNISRSGNELVLSGKALQNVTNLAGTNVTISQAVTGASITNGGVLSNASSTFGVDVSGITNTAFNGSVSGFTATYKNVSDTVDLSITIGRYTYKAVNVDVTNSTDTRVRLISDTLSDGTSGGFMDIQLDGGNILSFADQAGADAVASRLNVAFATLDFRQSRDISTYSGTAGISSGGVIVGSLVGTRVSAQFDSFDNLRLSDIRVTAPSGSATDARITMVINGVNYTTANGLGTKLGANQTYRLVSEQDPNQFVDFTTGNTAIQLDSSAKADAVEEALKVAFGATAGSAALSFQIGTTASDTLSVSISSAKTDNLYNGEILGVSTQIGASRAAAVLDEALNKVTSIRADVGALQSRFNFASANIQITIQNQDAARAELLETDVATESTAYATAQVKLQAGISVLAQANQQLQALLKLIG